MANREHTLAIVLAGLMIGSSAQAQVFDGKGNVQANVSAVVCQELPRLDAASTRPKTDEVIGTFGYGFMHGYFVGRIYRFSNPNEPTPQEQAYMEHLKKTYSDFMTNSSVAVVSALVRAFCSDPANDTKMISVALVNWLATIDK
jgi:hypothetical protein